MATKSYLQRMAVRWATVGCVLAGFILNAAVMTSAWAQETHVEKTITYEPTKAYSDGVWKKSELKLVK